jgi:hypothetical protein
VFRFCFFRLDVFFDLHIVEFLGVKDFATLQALYEFCVIMPGDDTYARVFADSRHLFKIGLD